MLKETYNYKSEQGPIELLGRLTCSRPIKATSEYSQWKGRAICAVKCLQTFVREPWRMVKQSIVLLASITICVHEIFDFDIKESLLMVVSISLGATSILMRAVIMIKEISHFAFGAIIHPKSVIENNYL